MTQEEKELLLKDLCARLPYGVKCQIDTGDADVYVDTLATITIDGCVCFMETIDTEDALEYDNIKPYLFPLSSMTEEQYNSLHELGILNNCSHSYEYVNPHIHGVSFIFKEFKTYSLELIEWLNKNHFDYRGLIPMCLAIDATSLNIY